MSDRDNRKRLKRRSKTYRKMVIITDYIFLIAILFLLIYGSTHTFTKKRPYRDKGVSCYKEAQYDEAIKYFDKALKCKQWFSKKMDIDIMLYKADCYVQMKQYSNASLVYKELKNYPESYIDHDELDFYIELDTALMYYDKGEYVNALPVLETACGKGYYDFAIYVANCYENMGDLEKMKAYCDLYSENVMNTSFVCYKNAVYYLDKKDNNTALEYVKKAQSTVDKEYIQEIELLEIICYQRLNDFKYAYELSSQYVSKYPDDTRGQELYDFLYTRINVDTNPINDIYHLSDN